LEKLKLNNKNYMGFFRSLFGEITIKTCGDKIGYLFNSTIFNSTSSGVGVAFTGANCARSFVKAIASPFPWCKGLYFAAGALNGVSCISSTVCLLSGTSCIAPIPIASGAIAYAASVGAQGCNSLADCMDPAAGLTSKGVDTCINLATKTFS
jgi:hypothetical protein